MDPIVQVTQSLTNLSVDIAALVLLLLFLVPFVVLTVYAKQGRRFAVRPIRAYDRIRQAVNQAAESGRPVHVGMGRGALGSDSTAEALMGITVFDYAARYAAGNNQAVTGTTGDPTVLAGAQGVLYQAREDAGAPERFRGHEVSFAGPEPLAYAANVHGTLRQRDHQASVLVGQYASEGLWIAETTQPLDIPQVAGTSLPSGAALLYVATEDTVIGEEVYAAGAYLHRPSHLGSLATQDLVRVMAILAIIVGVVLTTLGIGS